MAVAVEAALTILREEPEHQQRLTRLIAFAEEEIGARQGQQQGWHLSGSQIIPYIVGDNARAMALASALQARGFDIRGIRPPTVPVGAARLRISLTNNVDENNVRAMLDALAEVTGGEGR
jgi:7-keto-8-aminopelargonate synthetase-like enzyme